MLRATPDLHSVLGKTMAILWSLTADDPVLSLAELARRADLPKTTVHRLTGELVGHKMLERVDGGYRLGSAVLELGLRALVGRSLLEVATPFLQDLYERTHETVHLGVLDGTEVIYLAKIGGHRQTPTPSRTGGRMPLHCTAIGKVLLAYADAELRRGVLAGPLERRTQHTMIAPGLLDRHLDSVRKQGVAFEREESKLGLLCVAAPVFDRNGTTAVAAISVAGPVGRYRPESHVEAVKAAAAALSTTYSRNAAMPRADKSE
ncbi:IclR family transcriptional regulator domain-containing protein [Nocardia sp. R6R-6]|uniref:IclR family transcriptional regulator domain-containing protein n=1 Tax=Nocardia sp. R6R-6 TaxID=3459303 RepID=UPI00403DBA88